MRSLSGPAGSLPWRAGLILGLVLWLGRAATRADEFQSANAHYDAGRYAAAAAVYEAIQPRTAALYFNLGNAYFRQDNLGLAALNYQRARHLAPRDPDILANLRLAETRLGVTEVNQPTGWAPALWRSWVENWTAQEWRWMEILALWLSALAVAGWFWWPRRRIVWTTVLLVSLAALILAIAALVWLAQRPPAAVAIAATEARFAPLSAATVHFPVLAGTRVGVVEDRGSWWFVQRADGRRGWVPAAAVQRVARD